MMILRRARRLCAAFLACVVLLSLGACGSAAAAHLRVGFIGVGSTRGRDTAVMERQSVAGLRAAGETVTYKPSASADPMLQIDAADALLQQKINVLVVNMSYINLWSDTLLKFKAAGIPVVLLGSKPIGLKATMYDAYLGPSAHNIGTLLGQWVARAIAGDTRTTTRVLTVTEPLDSVTSADITNGWSRAVAPVSANVRTTRVVGSWNEEVARATVARQLDADQKNNGALPQVMVGYSGVTTAAILAELSARGIATSTKLKAGAVCVLGVQSTDRRLVRSVTWSSDYSKRLASIVQKLGRGEAIVKDNLVALRVKARSDS
jgi:ABC-type sugar transport system substrate-binding protein